MIEFIVNNLVAIFFALSVVLSIIAGAIFYPKLKKKLDKSDDVED